MEQTAEKQHQYYLPTLFNMWSQVACSRLADENFVDLFSRLARDSLLARHIPFSEYGVFTYQQSALIFTAILRLLDIPDENSNSAYQQVREHSGRARAQLESDTETPPAAQNVAQLIIMSLSPACLVHSDSVLSNLKILLQAVETHFHPSNSGDWTLTLSQLTFHLADMFVLRWNQERSGEMEVPDERRLDNALKRRFVLCLREAVFMGIFAETSSAMKLAISTLRLLAFLDQDLVLPGALQRIYPAMKDSVKVHRTIPSIRALSVLFSIMAKAKGYRCHIITLLWLVLPGIDANDLKKTSHTLSCIEVVSYIVSFRNLTKEKIAGHDGQVQEDDSYLADQWTASQILRLEEGDIDIDYNKELGDHQEEAILRSSTAKVPGFVASLFDRVFALLEKLERHDSFHPHRDSLENKVLYMLARASTVFLATLSPDLFDMALDKIAGFAAKTGFQQTRSAVGYLCNTLVRVNPEKSLKRLLPLLIASIYREIDIHGAGTTADTEIPPGDRTLMWNMHLLSYSLTEVGDSVLAWKEELFDTIKYVQQKCKGNPRTIASDITKRLLHNLTAIYIIDHSMHEKDELENELTMQAWGKTADLDKFNVTWHKPSDEEISFAAKLFSSQCNMAIDSWTNLIGPTPSIKQDGIGKEWSDEVSQCIYLFQSVISGISNLFDPRADNSNPTVGCGQRDGIDIDGEEDSTNLAETKDEEPAFQHMSGYPLDRGGENYQLVHKLRRKIGRIIHDIYQFLFAEQQDNLQCLEALCNASKSWFTEMGSYNEDFYERSKILNARLAPFKFKGLRKEYPRPLLIERAQLYHFQRLYCNVYSGPLKEPELTKLLLSDLVDLSLSAYEEVRRSAGDILDWIVERFSRTVPLVIPLLLDAFTRALEEKNPTSIEGAMACLLSDHIRDEISQHWEYIPCVIKAFVEATQIDSDSVQKLLRDKEWEIMDIVRPWESMVIHQYNFGEAIILEEVKAKIQTRNNFIASEKAKLSRDLIQLTKESHWKTKRCLIIKITENLEVTYGSIASEAFIDMITEASIDSHPDLRRISRQAMYEIFKLVDIRIFTERKYDNYLLDVVSDPNKNPWTNSGYEPDLGSETSIEKHYVDGDPRKIVQSKSPQIARLIPTGITYDDLEEKVLSRLVQRLDQEWLLKQLKFMKIEADSRFQESHYMLIYYVCRLFLTRLSNFADVQKFAESVFEACSDETYCGVADENHCGVVVEAMTALFLLPTVLAPHTLEKFWESVLPKAGTVLQERLDNKHWEKFLRCIMKDNDPRRFWPLIGPVFRVNMKSDRPSPVSLQIGLLGSIIHYVGPRSPEKQAILQGFIEHLDHPYDAVRSAMGIALARITTIGESYEDVSHLVDAQMKYSSVGIQPYQSTDEESITHAKVLRQLDIWQKDDQDSYTRAIRTLLVWWDTCLSSHSCTQLLNFPHKRLIELILSMVAIDEETELLAEEILNKLSNVPFRIHEVGPFVSVLIGVGAKAESWRHRSLILQFIDVFNYRNLFLISDDQRQGLIKHVDNMIRDKQPEVRAKAANTLTSMIRASPTAFDIECRRKSYMAMLEKNHQRPCELPTLRAERTYQIHGAVLGLGALLLAFPYRMALESWQLEVFTTLAETSRSGLGLVDNSVKEILAVFKEKRQDTWLTDKKVIPPLQMTPNNAKSPIRDSLHTSWRP